MYSIIFTFSKLYQPSINEYKLMKTGHFATERVIISIKIMLHNGIHYRSGMFNKEKVAGQCHAGKKCGKIR